MPLEDADDRATFFDTSEHGVTAIYRDSEAFARTGAATEESVDGIFGDAFREVEGIESSAPVFICAAESVPYAKQGDELDINSVTYRVVSVEPDGCGIVTLVLEDRSA